MIKKVCFLVNYNQYETKRHFTEKLAEALQRKQIETVIYDVNEKRIHETLLEKITHLQPDFTASFNSILPLSNESYLWDLLKIPHLSILLDPSLYSVSLIGSPYSIISCVDRFDCVGLASQDFKRVFFMPHAVERELFDAPRAKERIYDVVFLGSCYDYENLRQQWMKELPERVALVVDDAIDIVLSDNKTPLQEALVKAWRYSGLSPEGVDFLKLFTYVDKYSRGIDRIKLIRAIKDVKVHVFGEIFQDDPTAVRGWREQLKGMDNVVFHEPVSYPESLQIMQQSKICLNSNPFFKDGSHERIFAASACGAAVVTSDNLFVRENFVEGEDLILFQCKEWDQVNGKINALLRNEPKRTAMVKSCADKVRVNHTWDQRADLLMNVMPAMLQDVRAHIEF